MWVCSLSYGIGMVFGSILGPLVPTGEDKDLGSDRGNWIPAMRWFSRFGEALAVLPISWKSRWLFEDLDLQLLESIWVLGLPELPVPPKRPLAAKNGIWRDFTRKSPGNHALFPMKDVDPASSPTKSGGLVVETAQEYESHLGSSCHMKPATNRWSCSRFTFYHTRSSYGFRMERF